MLRKSVLSLFLVTLTGTLAQAVPTLYTGSLSSADGGLVGTGGWVANPDNPVTFSWTVTQNPDLTWHYHYEFDSTGVQGDLSHLLLETSLDVTADEILNAEPSIENDDPKWHGGSGNPNIPEDLFGIKFQNGSGAVVTIDFDSPRVPVWGDFFAKGGVRAGQLWNAGFTSPDTDPTDPAQNGSIAYHILRPDTHISTVPVPSAMLLGGLGAGLISWLRTRRVL